MGVLHLRTVCMIPVKLRSERCKYKNIREFANTTLINIAIDKALKCFDRKDIYINSRDNYMKLIAKRNNIRFHRRSAWESTEIETNDDFLYDFMKRVDCEYVMQINTTSPFTTWQNVYNMKLLMTWYEYDAIFSVYEIKNHCMFRDNITLNYHRCGKMKQTQDIEPMMVFTNGIMGWKKETAMKNMKKHGACVYGCWSNIRYYKIEGLATIDIDTEEEFKIAEMLYKNKELLK